MIITNEKRLEWLQKRVSYLEHDDKNGVSASEAKTGGWWPQTQDHEEYYGLDLISYIDAQIVEEEK